MRQIDDMKENLTKINGTAGNNHDGEKEKWKQPFHPTFLSKVMEESIAT